MSTATDSWRFVNSDTGKTALRCLRRMKLSHLICLSCLAGFTAGGAEHFAVTPDNFESFLNNPPEIELMLYERTLSTKPMFFRTQAEADDYMAKLKDGSVEAGASGDLFALRYLSHDSLVFQGIQEESQALSSDFRGSIFFGRGDGLWWTLSPTGAMTTDSPDGQYPMDDSIMSAYPANLRMATEILRLGMYDVALDSVTVSGARHADGKTTFSASSLEGQEIDGEIVSNGGFVSKISYDILDPKTKIVGRLIHLSHDAGTLSSVNVENVIAGSGKVELYARYIVKKLTLPTKPMGDVPGIVKTRCWSVGSLWFLVSV